MLSCSLRKSFLVQHRQPAFSCFFGGGVNWFILPRTAHTCTLRHTWVSMGCRHFYLVFDVIRFWPQNDRWAILSWPFSLNNALLEIDGHCAILRHPPQHRNCVPVSWGGRPVMLIGVPRNTASLQCRETARHHADWRHQIQAKELRVLFTLLIDQK